MLPRQLALPRHPPSKLNPSPSYSCRLFRSSKKVNSHQINSLQPLLQNTRGGGVHPHRPISFAPVITWATQRLYPLRPQPVAHTSRRHEGVCQASSFQPQVSSSVPLWQIPFCLSFVFTTIQI